MKYLSVILVLVLTGCGSESDSGRNATIEDLVGTWDTSEKIGQEIDELYYIIEGDGNVIDFDYDGDSYDKGSNCYYKYDGATLVDQGEGNFLVEVVNSEDYMAKISISGSTITVTTDEDGDSYTSKAVKIDRIESDFTPLCNELL